MTPRKREALRSCPEVRPQATSSRGLDSPSNNLRRRVHLPGPVSGSIVYRVRGIPRYYDDDKLRSLLYFLLGLNEEFNGLQIKSLAINAIDLTTKVATIEFQTKPEKLFVSNPKKLANWEFTFPEADGQRQGHLLIDTGFIGLTTLASPPVEKHEIDIIAITGLAGHAFHSFREKAGNHMWLRDSLPSDLPMARIIVYGYRSEVVNSESFQDLDTLGRGMCSSLEALLTEKKDLVPKIFVGHSLGGLVIKQSMILMKAWDDERSKVLYQTYGIVFLGVPNHGMKVEHLLSMVTGQPNALFVHNIQAESQLLQMQCDQFEKAFNFEDSEVRCFFETYRSPTTVNVNGNWSKTGPPAILVDKRSAKHGRSWKTGAVAMSKNHSDLAKFRRGDEDYIRLTTYFRRMVRTAKSMTLTRQPPPGIANYLRRLKRWLDPPIPETNHQRACKSLKSGTGEWFTEGEAFSSWIKTAGSPLWLFGSPGCGKTILSSTIIERIKVHIKLSRSTAFAFFYFDFNDKTKQTLNGLIRSLIFQLLTSQPEPALTCLRRTSLVDLADIGEDDSICRLSTIELVKILDCLLTNLSSVYLHIDALDECSEQRQLLPWLRQLMSNHKQKLHLMTTSRREEPIFDCLGDLMHKIPIENCRVDEDIRLYIEDALEIDYNFKHWSSDLKVEVANGLATKSKGMFRWAVCQMDTLRGCLSLWDVKKTLRELPHDLDSTYARALAKIPEHDRKMSLKLFQWIIHAARPITLLEAVEILITTPEENGQVEEGKRLMQPKDVLRYCGSLATIRHSTVYHDVYTNSYHDELILAHYSVQEYLVSNRVETPSIWLVLENQAHLTISWTCLQYLSHITTLSVGYTESVRYPLRNYFLYVAHNLRQIKAEEWTPGLIQEVIRMVGNPIFQAEQYNEQHVRVTTTPDLDPCRWVCPLGLASFLGLTMVARYLIAEMGTQATYHREQLMNALFYAALGGRRDIVELLLDEGVDADATSALLAATWSKYGAKHKYDTVKLLLNRGADVNLIADDWGQALISASDGGVRNVIKLLLDHGADVNAYIDWEQPTTPLKFAARKASEEVVELMLATGKADLEARQDGRTLLSLVAGRGFQRVVKWLLETGKVDVEAHDEDGRMPLSRAEENGHTGVVRLLLTYSRKSKL